MRKSGSFSTESGRGNTRTRAQDPATCHGSWRPQGVSGEVATEGRLRTSSDGTQRSGAWSVEACVELETLQLPLTGICAIGHDQHPQGREVDVPLISVCHQRPVHVPGFHTSHFRCGNSRGKGVSRRAVSPGTVDPRAPVTYLCTGRPSESRTAG